MSSVWILGFELFSFSSECCEEGRRGKTHTHFSLTFLSPFLSPFSHLFSHFSEKTKNQKQVRPRRRGEGRLRARRRGPLRERERRRRSCRCSRQGPPRGRGGEDERRRHCRLRRRPRDRGSKEKLRVLLHLRRLERLQALPGVCGLRGHGGRARARPGNLPPRARQSLEEGRRNRLCCVFEFRALARRPRGRRRGRRRGAQAAVRGARREGRPRL